jgi:hypothetical protein
MTCGRNAGLMLAGLLVWPMVVWVAPALAQTAVAPDDPKLIAKMNEVCLATALHSGGLDQKTRDYCSCVSPVFARHMTPESREKLLVENRTDIRPRYDDDNATFDDLMKACPPQQ